MQTNRVADWLWCRLRIKKRFHSFDWVNVLCHLYTQSAYVLNVYGLHAAVALHYVWHFLDAGWHTDYIRNKSCENTRTLCQIHCYISDSAILHFSVRRRFRLLVCVWQNLYYTIRLHRITFTLLLIYFSQASMFSSLLETLRKHSIRYNEERATKGCVVCAVRVLPMMIEQEQMY